MTETTETTTKPWYLSKGVIGGVISGVMGVLVLLGLSLPEDVTADWMTDQVMVVIEAAVAIVGSALAVYGRVKAKTTIGSSSSS